MRDLLRRRLSRRGLTPLAGIMTAALDGSNASAGAIAFPGPLGVTSFDHQGRKPGRCREGDGTRSLRPG